MGGSTFVHRSAGSAALGFVREKDVKVFVGWGEVREFEVCLGKFVLFWYCFLLCLVWSVWLGPALGEWVVVSMGWMSDWCFLSFV